ncbi:septal ring lytic transglycosylase RlpA family protein [Pacificimonas sp. ICDLI1SI03]
MTKEAMLPGRRARLKAFLKLKTEHRLARMAVGVSAVAIAGAGLADAHLYTAPPADVLLEGQEAGDGALSGAIVPEPGFASEMPIILPEPRADSATDPLVEAAAEAVEAAAEEIGLGEASYYGDRFAGRSTASGEAFDPALLTAAHRTLPLGSTVRVTHMDSGESVVVKINDRGPFHGQRIIDLSKAAARKIGMLGAGKARVKLELLRRS